jgi:hypothetical protein
MLALVESKHPPRCRECGRWAYDGEILCPECGMPLADLRPLSERPVYVIALVLVLGAIATGILILVLSN